MSKKKAVILFNLGGPDCPDSIEPFLFNLFNDKAIISVQNPIRYLLAKFISKKRAPVAKEIYKHMNGKSPLLEETRKQALELESSLNSKSDDKFRVFIAMRYWHPFSYEALKEVVKFSPDEIILLPLYPQYSTTTTGSSLSDWKKEAKKINLNIPTKAVNNYHTENNFIQSHVCALKKYYEEAAKTGKPRILFSAHGLPQKVIDKGDPYQKQIEATSEKIVKETGISNLDWVICYQSRVGPMKWIGPNIDEEIIRAGKDRLPVIIVPVAFVSEHSETLVELDIEYKKIAEDNNIPGYFRVPTLGTDEKFIESLSYVCLNSDRFI